jgi:hypothetical protein
VGIILSSTLTAIHNSAKTGEDMDIEFAKYRDCKQSGTQQNKRNFDTVCIVRAKRGESMPKDTRDRASSTQ